MDRIDELLKKAARFREIARMIGDDRTNAALIELVKDYEIEAEALLTAEAGDGGLKG